MRAQIGNLEFSVRWKYGTEKPAKGKERPTTTCIISMNKETVAEAQIKLYQKDVADKETARKVSLQKALQQYGFGKVSRKIFWESYLNRKGNNVNITPIL